MRGLPALILLLVGLQLQAQDAQTITGTYRYYVPTNESMETARHTAIQRARITALAKEFGETLSQTQTILTKEDNGQLTDALYVSGDNIVNGEWLNDTQEPIVEQGFENNQLYIQATVCGAAKRLSQSSVELEYHLFRNTADNKSTTIFTAGDQLYLSLKSPVNGFVAVYLTNETKTAYCLLPYRNQKSGSQFVEANKHYLFFDAKGDKTNTIDEYELNCDDGMSMAFNDLYIIFSKTDFSKSVDYEAGKSKAGLDLPRSLPLDNFLNWLNRQRASDAKMQVVKETISINLPQHNHH